LHFVLDMPIVSTQQYIALMARRHTACQKRSRRCLPAP
jgi:hypothetical protein